MLLCISGDVKDYNFRMVIPVKEVFQGEVVDKLGDMTVTLLPRKMELSARIGH